MVAHRDAVRHVAGKWTGRSAWPTRVSGVKSPDPSPAAARSGLPATAVIRPMRSDALKNRERLLAAAGRVFEEKGLEASVADVARAAGVGMGTLYRHFPSKEALVEALVSEVLETTIALAEAAADRPDGAGLEQFLRESSAYQAEHLGCLPKLWITDHHLVQTARDLIAGLLSDAQAHGRIRSDLRSTDISLALWSIRGVLETTGPNAREAWERHLDLLIAGMRPTDAELAHGPLGQNQIDRILARREASPVTTKRVHR
jgi:AcrR family transcriptional regulator